MHTLSLLYQLTTQLATADATPEAASSSSGGEDDDDDAETRAKNEALGLGGAALKAVLSEINSADANQIPVKGGEVLSILHERAQHLAGDPAARALYGALLRAGGKPYVGVLRVWAATGRLVDPYEEVCVKESKFIHRGTLEQDYIDEYWERRYTVGAELPFCERCSR